MEIMSFEDALLMQAAKFTIQRKAAPGDHVYYNGKLAVLAVDNSPKRVHSLKIIMLDGPFSGRSYKLTGKRIAAIIMVPTVQDILKQMPEVSIKWNKIFFITRPGLGYSYAGHQQLLTLIGASWRNSQPPLTIKKIQA